MQFVVMTVLLVLRRQRQKLLTLLVTATKVLLLLQLYYLSIVLLPLLTMLNVALFFFSRVPYTLKREGVENVIGDDNRLVVRAIGSSARFLLLTLTHSHSLLLRSPGTMVDVCLMLPKLNTAIFGGNANLI